jgi:formate hydrogenlyase subunit 3/multisubunit Na+/H+ antiporter MnhD subunit
MSALLPLAPVPALIAALVAPDGATLVLPQTLLGLTLTLDTPGAMLLGTAALLWIAAGIYAHAWMYRAPSGGRLAVWWLMTLTGSLGVFMAADMISFYLFFTLVSLAAYGLVGFDNTSAARRAGAVYVSFAVLGEAFLLMGFVFCAAASPHGSLLTRDAVAALPTSPWRDPALAFLILGFGVKIGLVPLHVWMPLTYSAAPIPAAAVLSGAAVKAGVIGLIRFLPFEAASAGWGEALAAIGLFAVFYGVLIGITQANPKTVLAYSSVSQMGLIATVLGTGLAAGDTSVPRAAAFYAVYHVLAKGGLFLALGIGEPGKSRKLWLVLLPAAVLALGLGGLPLTGGALAKLAIKAPLGDGVVGVLAILSAMGSTLLMIHFLRRLALVAAQDSQVPTTAGIVLPWLAIAAASVALLWALYGQIGLGPLRDALAVKEIWAALWPVLVGALLAAGLWRWGHVLPAVPAGDVLTASNSALRAARHLSAAMETIDEYLRRWPVAGVLFLALTAALAITMLAGR